MATLTLHNIPDSLHDTLQRQAKLHRHSVDEEAIAVFEQVLPKALSRTEEIARVIAETAKLRQRMASFFTAEQIDAAINEGRA